MELCFLTVFGLQIFCEKMTGDARDSKGKRTCRNMDMGQNRYQDNGGNWVEIIMENSKKNYTREKKFLKKFN
jgi:peroxiredoxin family protein